MTATPEWLERKSCRPEHSALFFPGGGPEAGTKGNPAVDYSAALNIWWQP